MNNDVCATLEDLFEALSECIEKEDIIYAKTTSHIVSSLVKERFKRNMTQQDFAELMDVKQSMISRWESGSSNFTIKTLSKIAADLDLDLYVNLVSHKEVNYTHKAEYKALNKYHSSHYNFSAINTTNSFKYGIMYSRANKTVSKHKEVSKW